MQRRHAVHRKLNWFHGTSNPHPSPNIVGVHLPPNIRAQGLPHHLFSGVSPPAVPSWAMPPHLYHYGRALLHCLSFNIAILGKSKINHCAKIPCVFFLFFFFKVIWDFYSQKIWCEHCPSFPFLLSFYPSLSLSLLKSLISSWCMCFNSEKSVLKWTLSIYWCSFPTSRHPNQKLSEQHGQDSLITFGLLNQTSHPHNTQVVFFVFRMT